MKRRRLLVIPAVAALVALPASVLGAAAQAPEDTQIIHRQAVSVQMSPTGEQGTTRLVTQLTYLGNESSSITLPAQATRGFRNLSGFGAPSVSGDNVTWDFAGPGFVRSLAEVDGDLPVRVEINYSLDGQEMAPDKIVGRSGLLEVTYTVTNLTAEEREVSYVDGMGNAQTATVPVAVPMVGSLTTTLDGRFKNVESPGAVVVGDGRGNTLISASLLMFAPLASETAQASYRAQVTDAIIPTTKLQVLPVDSNSFGSITSTETAYAGAAESLTELTDGSGQIDQNLLKLAAGAGELLDGLSQLADGADELAAGLQTAASGSGRLAAGTTDARAGGQRLAAGLDLLLAGARELSGGLGQANTGGGDLAAGLARLAAGAGELAAGAKTLAAGTTALNAGATELSAGAKALAAGSNILDAGAQELVAGAGQLSGGAADLLDGLKLLKASLNADDGLPAALDGIGSMLAGLGSRTVAGETILFGLTQVAGGLSNPGCNLPDPTEPREPVRGSRESWAC
jgi:putative membrane protein